MMIEEIKTILELRLNEEIEFSMTMFLLGGNSKKTMQLILS